MFSISNLNEEQTLARTIWGEARGEGAVGMLAIACVVMNRIAANSWWGKDIKSVCLKTWQFSCWNENDPNRSKLLSVTEKDEGFTSALGIAKRVIAGHYSDVTDGATHYFDRRLTKYPDWSINQTPCMTIGHHVFFRGIK